MNSIFSPTATLTLLTVTGTLLLVALVGSGLRRVMTRRPTARTTAAQRLLARNPTLGANVESLRWSVAARRVRTGPLTALTVALAVLVASARPTVVSATDDRN